MTKLRWEPFPHHDCLVGYSGAVDIAVVVKRFDGQVVWKIDGVAMKWNFKGRGEAKTISVAKRTAERQWGKWLAKAGLKVPK